MNPITRNNTQVSNWRTTAYIIGALIGAALGFLSAYLYAQAADEEVARTGGEAPKLSTGQMIALGLTTLGLIRQISEAGRPPKK
jgi:hypothetical protein